MGIQNLKKNEKKLMLFNFTSINGVGVHISRAAAREKATMFLHHVHYNVKIYQTPVSSISKVHFYRSVIFYTVTAHKLQPEVKST